MGNFVLDWEGKLFNLLSAKWIFVREAKFKDEIIGYGIFADLSGHGHFLLIGCACAPEIAQEWLLAIANNEAPQKKYLMSLTFLIDASLAREGPNTNDGDMESSVKRINWLDEQRKKHFQWGEIVKAQGE